MTQTVYTPQRPLDLVLLSPKGPLYRKRGGIFKRSLRYQPLTLTTLSALVPKSLPVNIRLIDESIEELPEDFTADLVAMTVITGNAPRAYELAAQMRAKNIPVVLGGPHVTLLPQEALQHADTVCTGYSEQSWPQLIRDFMAGNMQREYRQGADFTLDIPDLPFPERERFDAKHFLTQGFLKRHAPVLTTVSSVLHRVPGGVSSFSIRWSGWLKISTVMWRVPVNGK